LTPTDAPAQPKLARCVVGR